MDNANVLKLALDLASNDLPNMNKSTMAKVTFHDNNSQNLDPFSAKKIVSCYSMLDDDNKKSFEFMLNKDATSFIKLEICVHNA